MSELNSNISTIEKENIEKYLHIVYRNCFDGSITKNIKDSKVLYGFPYYDSKVLSGYKYFNYGYKYSCFKRDNSYWSLKHNILLDVDYLIVSDEPISILKFFSSRYDFFKNKAVLGIAPKLFKKEVFDILLSEYLIHNIISVFDNPENSEILKIKLTCFFRKENVIVNKSPQKVVIIYKNKKIESPSISYSYFRKKMNIKSIIKHKKNKS